RGYRRHLAADPSALRAVDADRDLVLFASVGTGADARRGVAPAQQTAEDQLYRHRGFLEPDRPRGFRGDHPGAAAAVAAAMARARPLHQQVHRPIARDPEALPADLSGRT